jgi:hypothetical protein
MDSKVGITDTEVGYITEDELPVSDESEDDLVACMDVLEIFKIFTKSFVTSVTPLKRPRCSQPVLAEPFGI